MTTTNNNIDLENWLIAKHQEVFSTFGWLLALARVFRTSGSRADLFRANLEVGLTAADDSEASVRKAREVGSLIVERSVEGEAARLEHGVFTLRMHHLKGGAGRRVVGYLVVFEGVLFVYLLASAAKQNLKADHTEDDGNATAEALRVITRTLSNLSTAIDETYRLGFTFTDDTRPARSESAAEALIRTFVQYGVLVTIGVTVYDPSIDIDRKALRRAMTFAADERDASTQRLAKGKAGLLVSHHLPDQAFWTTPFTHTTKFVERTDPASGRIFLQELKNTLAVDEQWVPVLAEIVHAVLENGRRRRDSGDRAHVNWDALAANLGPKLGLRARGPSMMLNGRLICELAGPGAALKRMIQPRYVQAWRTGQLPWQTTFAGDIGALADRLQFVSKNNRGLLTASGWVSCPVPECGWGVTDAEWDELETLLQPTSPGAGRPPSGWQYPVNESTWLDGDLQYRAQWKNGRVEVHHRPAIFAVNQRGTAAGWNRSKEVRRAQLTTVGCMTGRAFSDQLADRLEKLATSLADQIEPLTLCTPATDETAARRTALNKEIGNLETQTAKLAKQIEGARDRGNEGRGDSKPEMVEAAEKDIARYEGAISEALARLDDVRGLLAIEDSGDACPEELAPAAADFSTLELVVAGLRTDWTSHGAPSSTSIPEALGMAARSLHRNRYRVMRDGLVMKWEMEITLNLRDGGLATTTINGQLPNRMVMTRERQGLDGGIHSHRDPTVIARRYLLDGATYEALGADLGIDGSGRSNTHLSHQLKSWLANGQTRDGTRRAVPSTNMRRVILDIPVRDTTAIIFRHIAGESHPADVDPNFVQHIINTYFGAGFNVWPESWTPEDWKLSRTVMSLLASADPVDGLPVKQLMTRTGASYNDIMRLAGPGAKQSQGMRRPPLFATNFDRHVDYDDRHLAVSARCENQRCPERGGGGAGSRGLKNRVVLATHVLWVPEIPAGVLCVHCRTMPGLPDVTFPDDYFQAFRRTSKAEHGIRSRTVLAA